MAATATTDKSYLLEANEVRRLATGRWSEVYAALAPNQFGKCLTKPGSHGPCPFPGHSTAANPSKDGFRFFPHELQTNGNGGGICNTCGNFSDGFKVLRQLFGWNFPETLSQVFTALGGRLDSRSSVATSAASVENARPPAEPADLHFDIENARRIRARLGKVWSESVDLHDPTARTLFAYWRARGVPMPMDKLPENIKLHPRLIYRDVGEATLGFFPAMLARIVDPENRPVTIHRTYINKQGRKALVPKPKKCMEVLPYLKMTGGAVRLFPLAGPRLHVTEGIETAMAVRLILDHAEPVWATTTAVMLEAFEPPEEVKEVWVWMDKDRTLTGESSGNELLNRLCQHGMRCRLVHPPIPIPNGQKSVDFLDLVREFPPEAIRKSQFFQALKRKM